jgi:molybdenum cofactor cytidylyltransferase
MNRDGMRSHEATSASVSRNSRIAAIVLAAGSSRRMGSPKALLPFDDRPLIACVVDAFADVGISRSVVVTGHQPQLIHQALAGRGVEFVHNAEHDAGGMVSSVQLGVKTIAHSCDAFFLALGDQPLVDAETLRQVIAVGRRTLTADVVLPTHAGRHGHPILIRSRCARDILSLPLNLTLRQFVKRDDVVRVEAPVDDPAILLDVDTPEQYRHALHLWQIRRSSACPPDETRTSSPISQAGKV